MLPCPSSSLHWGIGSLANSYTTFDINSDGLCTYTTVVTKGGIKIWIVIGPRLGEAMTSSNHRHDTRFASVNNQFAFHNCTFVDTKALGDVQVEAVVLTVGTRL